ncbi:MAG: nickel pincer cofactor biosynthesis protein LarB [Coriobacteriales bacterium]|jgi:NCAIR mutase (PurE)-related protein|nr:nickel pincer cofactor biosynthesis protein LarB [Coriobacteriales bacterium]
MDNLNTFANLDYSRAERCGFPEVIYGAGKTPEQLAEIAEDLLKHHDVALATRANAEHAKAMRKRIPDAQYVSSCGILYADRRAGAIRISGEDATSILAQQYSNNVDKNGTGDGGHDGNGSGGEDNGSAPTGNVLVCCAGTSDIAVAEEAAITARIMGSRVRLLADVGVAGIHRLLSHEGELQDARAIVAVAGMEGALPSVVAGLVNVPVVAVPTSVGYGANFGGVTALMAMLNSCAMGVSVVNIDNGFGAGVIAHRINAPMVR